MVCVLSSSTVCDHCSPSPLRAVVVPLLLAEVSFLLRVLALCTCFRPPRPTYRITIIFQFQIRTATPCDISYKASSYVSITSKRKHYLQCDLHIPPQANWLPLSVSQSSSRRDSPVSVNLLPDHPCIPILMFPQRCFHTNLKVVAGSFRLLYTRMPCGTRQSLAEIPPN